VATVQEERDLRGFVRQWSARLGVSIAVMVVAWASGSMPAGAQGVRNPLQVDLDGEMACADPATWTVILTATNHDSYPARLSGSVSYDGQTRELALSPNPLPPGASGRAELAVPPFGQGSWRTTAVPVGPGVSPNQGGQGRSKRFDLNGCAGAAAVTVPAPAAADPVGSGRNPVLILAAGAVAVLVAAAAALAVLQRRNRSDPERDGDPPG
jgi:hypothetical protein